MASIAYAQTPTAEGLYDAGTNAGMHYLAEFAPVLRNSILTRECGFARLSAALGGLLPNSLEYALSTDDVLNLPQELQIVAAITARSYVLGYETGVATEHSRMPDGVKSPMCEAAAAAAGQMLSPDR